MISRNLMLACTIDSTLLNGKPDDALIHVAVHAWYEGHAAAKQGRSVFVAPDANIGEPAPFPSPPFPDMKDPMLWDIIAETNRRFPEPELLTPAVAYAASLAWTAGYQEGRRCTGCRVPGVDAEQAARIRAGEVQITLRNPLDTPSRVGPFPPIPTSAKSPRRRTPGR